MTFKKTKDGFMLLEIIIAMALISISFVTLLGIMFFALNITGSVKKEIQANSLAAEEFEALRSFRDSAQWSSNGVGSAMTGSSNPYHLENVSGQWALIPGSETTGIFTRQIIFDRVSRDLSNQNIQSAYNPSNDDPDTRKVTVTVIWQGKTIEDSTYLTNWK